MMFMFGHGSIVFYAVGNQHHTLPPQKPRSVGPGATSATVLDYVSSTIKSWHTFDNIVCPCQLRFVCMCACMLLYGIYCWFVCVVFFSVFCIGFFCFVFFCLFCLCVRMCQSRCLPANAISNKSKTLSNFDTTTSSKTLYV